MTATGSAIFHIVLYGGMLLSLVIFAMWKWFGHKRRYLPFVDLLGHTLGGMGFLVAIYTGLTTFQAANPHLLEDAGLTDESEPYKPAYSKVRERYQATCQIDDTTIDCREMRRFIRGVWADDGIGEPTMIRFNQPISPDVSAETKALIDEYRSKWALVPVPATVMAVVFHYVQWFLVPLLFGWMLGIHRRWIVLRQTPSS